MCSAKRTLALTAMLVLLACSASAARAEETRVNLTWQKPPLSSCPTRRDMISDVEALTEGVRFVDRGDAELWLDGGIELRDDEMHANIVVRLPDGSVLGARELPGSGDCAALRAPLALILTMLIESATTERMQESPRRLHVGLHGALLSGALPRLVTGGGLTLAISPRSNFRLSLGGSLFLPVDVEGREIRTRLTVWMAGLELCGRLFGGERVGSFLCAAGHAGATHAATEGLVGPKQVARLLTLAEIAIASSVSLTRWLTLTGSLGFVAYLHRSRFFYERSDGMARTLHRAEPFGLLARVGLRFDAL
jgi:hypothetical protein